MRIARSVEQLAKWLSYGLPGLASAVARLSLSLRHTLQATNLGAQRNDFIAQVTDGLRAGAGPKIAQG
jgi:hypothetical protein